MKSVCPHRALHAVFGTIVSLFFVSTSAGQEFATIRGDQFVCGGRVIKLKGTNYYPANHMWGAMWSSWDWPEIQAEAVRMRDLGLNCARILVPYSTGGWTYNPSATKLQQLEDIVNLFGQYGIRSVVTLFDWETSFPAAGTSTETNHYIYVTAIVNRLKNNPYVLFWDVKNEPDHPSNYGSCDCNPGACGDWDCNPTKRDKIVSWLQRMCNKCRQLDANHPAAAGMRWWKNIPDVLSFVDVAIFHSYWPNIYSEEIPQTRSYMGANPKPIVVEEWGWPSNPHPCYRSGTWIYDYNDSAQLDLYTAHLRAIEQYGIAGGLQWMTFDEYNYYPDPNTVTTPDNLFERFFGIWKHDGVTLKPAGVYYRDHMPVPRFSQIAPVGTNLQNPSFEDNGGMLSGWELAWVSGETVDVPPWDNTNIWGPRTTYGTHFGGKITNGLSMNFYMGQVIQATNWNTASLKANWQLSTNVQMRCMNSSTAAPANVHQVWEIGWNNDGSIPVGMMFCDNYTVVANINGNYTRNSSTSFTALLASGVIKNVRGLKGLAIRVHMYNDGSFTWTHNNIDNTSLTLTSVAPPAADADTDGDVDSGDFDVFSDCYNGPVNVVTGACLKLDFNGDHHVDAIDFDTFSACYNGPNKVPGC